MHHGTLLPNNSRADPRPAITSHTRLHPGSILKTITLDRSDQEKNDQQDSARSL
jgi:hypothetical protein